MDNPDSKFNFLYSPITSESLALKVIRESVLFFIAISCIQIIFSVMNTVIYESIVSGIIVIILAALLYKFHNRFIAIIFILLTITELIFVIVMLPQKLGIVWFMKVIAIIISVRAFQATNYLNKFSTTVKPKT